MSKQIKQMEMDALKKRFQGISDFVVLNVKGVGATVDNGLRTTLRKKNIRLQMVKNSLARRVFREIGLTIGENSSYWKGNSVLAWGAGSIAELSQALDAEFKGKAAATFKDKITVKGAICEGQELAFEKALKMPTRAQAIGTILSMILGPASQIAGQIIGPAAQIAGQIKTLSDKKPEEAAPAA
jgi:large subunit ribosomal protein L10